MNMNNWQGVLIEIILWWHGSPFGQGEWPHKYNGIRAGDLSRTLCAATLHSSSTHLSPRNSKNTLSYGFNIWTRFLAWNRKHASFDIRTSGCPQWAQGGTMWPSRRPHARQRPPSLPPQQPLAQPQVQHTQPEPALERTTKWLRHTSVPSLQLLVSEKHTLASFAPTTSMPLGSWLHQLTSNDWASEYSKYPCPLVYHSLCLTSTGRTLSLFWYQYYRHVS